MIDGNDWWVLRGGFLSRLSLFSLAHWLGRRGLHYTRDGGMRPQYDSCAFRRLILERPSPILLCDDVIASFPT